MLKFNFLLYSATKIINTNIHFLTAVKSISNTINKWSREYNINLPGFLNTKKRVSIIFVVNKIKEIFKHDGTSSIFNVFIFRTSILINIEASEWNELQYN